MTKAEDKPIRRGRYWLMPDGSLVPYIAGGSDDGDAGDSGAGGSGTDDGAGNTDPNKEELAALMKEVKSSRAEAAKYRRQLREKEEALGNVDVDKYQKLLDAEQQAEQQKLADKGKYDELLVEHQRRSEAQLSKSNDTLSMWKQRYEAQVVDNVLLSAASDKAIDSGEAMTLLRAKHKFNITDTGDVEILGSDEQVVLDDTGNPITPQQMMTTFLESKPHLCKPTGGGSGSRGSGAPSKNNQGSSDPNLTGAQRIAAALKARMAA